MHMRLLPALTVTVLAFSSGCTREAPSSSFAPAQPNTMTLSAAVPTAIAAAPPIGGAVALGAGAVSVRRAIPAGTGSIYLVFEGMGADAPPGVLFRVWVDDAPAPAINFYNYRRNPSNSYDVTRLVKAGQCEVVITIVPEDGAPAVGSHARIDNLKLVRQ
jgi:hypothetical protein